MYAETTDFAIRTGLFETVANGGSTQSITGADIPSDGFMVSVGMGKAFDTGLLDTNHAWSMVFDFAAGRFHELVKPGYFLGFWIDTETNLIWVDVSRHFTDREAALSLARDMDEIAIWDIGKAEEIRTN